MDGEISCTGLQEALREPVSAEEASDDADSEIEANSADSWNLLLNKANSVLQDASMGVGDNTDREYKR
jgi:hypothetical protein